MTGLAKGKLTEPDMKRTLLTAAIFLLVSSAVEAQPYYPLACRGGGAMTLTIGTEIVQARLLTRLSLRFTPMATAATGTTPPGEGQCSWRDRALRAGEPHVLRLDVWDSAAHAELQGGQLANLAVERTSPTVAAANLLIDAYRSGRDFSVFASNTGQGVMVVSQVDDHSVARP